MDFASLEKRNNTIIEWTIQKYEADRAKRQKTFEDDLLERSDAVATFLKAVDKGYGGSSMRYFGRSELARLRGEKIIEKLKSTAMIVKK